MQIKYIFKKLWVVSMLFVVTLNSRAQERPKLVVGITVDQMRWDYLYHFQSCFPERGGQVDDEGWIQVRKPRLLQNYLNI